MNWLYTWLGLSNASGAPYLFWSGFFGDLTIFAAMVGFYFHRMCHDDRCHRWGRHTVDGSPYCKKHKPVLYNKNQ